MAFTNSILTWSGGIEQPNYAGSSVGNALVSATAVSVTVQGTTAMQSSTSFMIHGRMRLKLYTVGGTTPTWQFTVYNNSSSTGPILYESPVFSGTNGCDITVEFQTETAVTTFVIVPTATGTTPTGTLDFEYFGAQ